MKNHLMLCALLLSVLLSGCAAEPLQGQTAGNTPKAPTPQEETPASFEPVSTDSSAPTKAPTEPPIQQLAYQMRTSTKATLLFLLSR